MCGIAGILYFEKERNVNESSLKNMTDTIVHRGPDDEGFYVSGNIGMGFRRLSIIDLSTGHQPLSNHDNSIWITFNGEIYNYLEIRSELESKGYKFKTQTDTEVIVNLYEEYAENCVDYLRGMFAFVIWDSKRNRLFGARDRFGIKPFFYYITNNTFYWASEIKSLKQTEDFSNEINIEAFDSYFAYGYTSSTLTIYSQIRKLEPASFFIVEPEHKNIKIKKYWEIKFEPDYSLSIAEWRDLLLCELIRSVKMRMISDVPLGAFLSGGIDSSAIVAIMSDISTNQVKTFSIGFQENEFNELDKARIISQKYNTLHHEMILEPESTELISKLAMAYDEPFADSSAIPTYYVSKYAREFVTVALSGDGGDELFAGYNSYSKLLSIQQNKLLSLPISKILFRNLNQLLPDYLFGKGYTYYLSKQTEELGASYCILKDYERKKLYSNNIYQVLNGRFAETTHENIASSFNSDFLSSLQGLNMKTYMVDDVLTKVDRASMLNSLEVRVPILDHKVAEISFKIPSKLKLFNGQKKYILKETIKNYLPTEIMKQTKQGFAVPLKYWFKDDLSNYITEKLNASNRIYDYLNKSYISLILNNHHKGIRDYSRKIWSILFFTEWLEQNN